MRYLDLPEGDGGRQEAFRAAMNLWPMSHPMDILEVLQKLNPELVVGGMAKCVFADEASIDEALNDIQ